MRNIFILIGTVMMLFALAANLSQAKVTLVEDGQPRAVIVTASDAPDVVRYAASELQYHIKKASGAELAILSERDLPPQTSARVYLGNCQAARDVGIDVQKLAPETCVVRSQDDAVFIAGRDTSGDPLDQSVWAGTLFGVYELIEKNLKVRWLWPGELGEVVPHTESIAVKDIDITVKPHFVQRWIRTTQEWHEGRRDEMVWLRRHRMGRSRFLYPTHSFRNWWEKYGKEHPEYFNLLPNGKREPVGLPSEVSMCVSEPRLWKQIIENWLEMPEESPGVRPIIDISENDGVSLCTCVRCRSWDADNVKRLPTEVTGPDGKLQTIEHLSPLSDRYARFYLSVQQEAAKYDCEASVIGFAYANYIDPPVKAKLNDHVIIGTVPELPFPDTREAVERSRSNWLGWRATGAQLYLRPNYFLQGYCMPYIFAETFGKEFQFAAKNGMIGTDFDALTGMYGAQGPNLYLLARMHVRPFEDPKKLLDEYYQGFGPAAKQVKAYFDYWGKVSRRIEKAPSWPYWPKSVQELYRPKDFEGGFRLLKAAKAECGISRPALDRVEFLEKGLKNAQLSLEVALASVRDNESGDGEEKTRALIELVQFRKGFEQNPYIANLGYLRWSESICGWVPPEDPAPDTVVILPVKWRFKLDSNNEGLQNGWGKTLDFVGWAKINTNASWTDQGHDYHGAAWYAVTFELPAGGDAADRPLALRFGAVDGYCDIFLDGIKIGEQKESPDSMWDKEFFVAMPDVEPGQHTLVVRVEKEHFNAGIWKPVSIRITER